MKKIYLMLAAAAVTMMALSGCKKEDPYFTAGENDFPRILNTDIKEMSEGKPSPLPNIYRDENFTFTAIVTPTQYTTVSWIINGVKVAEGTTIDMPLMAGDYTVKILATTTLGKETYRNCTLKVLARPEDPALGGDAKSKWINPGKEHTIVGSNFSQVNKLYLAAPKAAETKVVADDSIFDLTEIEGINVTADAITFTLPAETAEGDYAIVAETAAGDRFGCGNVTVSNEKFVEPGKVEKTLWEGSVDINWGDSNVQLTPADLADVPVGTVLTLHYEMIEADYHALRVTNQDWSKDIVAQVDEINDNYPDSYEFTYDAAAVEAIGEGSMVITGFGYKLTKITYTVSAPAETVLWEGATDINWGDSNVQFSAADLSSVEEGSTICLQYEMIEADYHALRVTNQDWSKDIVAQVDEINNNFPESYEFTYDAAAVEAVGEGSMVITGFGYKLTKVVVK